MQLRLESRVFTYQVETKPGTVVPFTFTFKDSLPFSISSIKWNYSIPGTVSDKYGWPKTPLEVTVDGICEAERGCPIQLSTPVIARAVSGSVRNGAHIAVNLCIQFQGSLVIGDVSQLTDDQIAVYTSLDTSQRAMLGLQQLMGLKQLPGMQLSGQAHSLGVTEPKALETADTSSLMFGDLFQASNDGLIGVDAIKKLADYLLKKGWRR